MKRVKSSTNIFVDMCILWCLGAVAWVTGRASGL